MKVLKAVNKINTIALGSYLVYFVFGYNDFFISKDQQGTTLIALFLFLTTFICTATVFAYANKVDVSSDLSIENLKKLPKFPVMLWGIICLAEIVILIMYFKKDIIIWCIATLIVSYCLTIAQRAIIPQIIVSSRYKIAIPWYFYPIPFILFFAGNIYAAEHLSEKAMNLISFAIFGICAFIIASIVWHKYYTVDEKSKTIEKSSNLFLLRNKEDKISFDDITYIESKGIYYIIHTKDDKAFKISKIYSDSKRFIQTMTDNAVNILKP